MSINEFNARIQMDVGTCKNSHLEAVRASYTFGTWNVTKSNGDQQQALATKRREPGVMVCVGPNDQIRRGLLPMRNGYLGGNRPVNRYSVGRFFHRVMAWFSDRFGSKTTKLSVQGPYANTLVVNNRGLRALNKGFGNLSMEPRNEQLTIQASDEYLVSQLGYGAGDKAAYAIADYRAGSARSLGDSLFGNRAPQISDIRQSDKRSTCYFLATLAGVLKQPDGAERIENIMRDNMDGTVTVRFADADVRVSKDRIVNDAGQDIFSVGAPWVRVMEKAFLAYIARGSQNGTKGFDRNSPLVAQGALVHTLSERPNQCATLDSNGATKNKFSRTVFTSKCNAWRQETMHNQIETALSQGAMVSAGVKDTARWFNRLTPGHMYCILSIGKRTTKSSNGKSVVESGYWMFDPYGESVGKVDPNHIRSVEQNYEAVLTDGTRGKNACFFVSQVELLKMFSEIHIASPCRNNQKE